MLAKAGTIALEVGKQIVPTIGGLLLKVMSGEGGITGQLIAALVGGRLLLGGLRTGAGLAGTFREAYSSRGGLRGAFNRKLGRPFGRIETYEQRRERLISEGLDQRIARREIENEARLRRGLQPLPPYGRTGAGIGGGRPSLDDLLRTPPAGGVSDRYSLDPMFENIRRTNEIERFNREFGESQRAFRDKELFQRRMASSRFGTEGPLARGTNPLAGSQYLQQIGPLPHGSAEPWTMTERGYQPYMGQVNEEAILEGRRQEILRRQIEGDRNPLKSPVRGYFATGAEDALPGSFDMSRGNVAARFNRR